MSLEKFFARLGPVARDQFLATVAEGASTDSRARAEKIEQELLGLKRKIDALFAGQKPLKEQVANVDSLLPLLGDPSGDAEVEALRLWLVDTKIDLQRRISERQPAESDLRRKQDLAQELDRLHVRGNFCVLLTERLRLGVRAVERRIEA